MPAAGKRALEGAVVVSQRAGCTGPQPQAGASIGAGFWRCPPKLPSGGSGALRVSAGGSWVAREAAGFPAMRAVSSQRCCEKKRLM